MKEITLEQIIAEQNAQIKAIEGFLMVMGNSDLNDEQRGFMEAIGASVVALKETSRKIKRVLHGTVDLAVNPVDQLHILLIEDDPVQHLFVTRALADAGHMLKIAHTGMAGFDFFASEQFDAVILDCQLPDIDGFQVCTAIRKQEMKMKSKPIPIIAYTSQGSPGYMEKCLEVGMNDYILKPVSLAFLRSKIEEIAKLNRPEKSKAVDKS